MKEEIIYPRTRIKFCSKCKHPYPIDNFSTDNSRIDGKHSHCRKCKGDNRRKWNEANPEKRKLQKKAYLKNPEKRKIRNLKKSLKEKYGLSLSDYENMVESQKGVCLLCQEKCSKHNRLSVDHNHITGKVRGLLCSNCNMGLGLFKDNIKVMKRAIDYLQSHP